MPNLFCSTSRTWGVRVTLIATWLLPACALRGGEVVKVELRSGRTFEAEIDARSSDERLWLRFGKGGAYLYRGVEWSQISRAELNGESCPVAELRLRLADLATETPAVAQAPQAKMETSPAVLETSPLTSIGFDAWLANWDADVEADGLTVQLLPLASDGQLARVGGTLDVDLVAIRRRDFNQVPDGRGRTFDRLARWTVSVSAAEIGADGATIRLPFMAVHPEFDTSVSPYGLVHLRFSSAGFGVFEASQDVVRIRPFAPLRDAREQSGLSRFLDVER